MADIPLSSNLHSRRSPRRPEPDAHGQAALLLIESVIHALLDQGSLTLGAAVAAVQTAANVKADVAQETGESRKIIRESLGLLNRIERSLKSDAPDRIGPTFTVV